MQNETKLDENSGENQSDRETNTPDQVNIDQIQTGDPGRMMHSDKERLTTEQDPTKTPLTKEGDEEVADELYKQEQDLNQ